MKLKLTKSLLDSLPSKESQYIAWDTSLRGFGVLVNRGGAKTFVVQHSIKGRNTPAVRITIGRYGPFTVDEARIRAGKLLQQMAEGKDPREEERKAVITKKTLQEAVDDYLETCRTKELAERTIADYKKITERYLFQWMSRRIMDIGGDRDGTKDLHRKISRENGRVAANQALGTLRAIYNRARRTFPSLPPNPTEDVDFHPYKPKEKAIPEALMPAWWSRINAVLAPVRRDLYQLLLFTGLRSESARTIRWEHIDWEEKTLQIPRPKGGEKRAFTLPLNEHLIGLLRGRQTAANIEGPGSPWAFPSLTAKAGFLAEAKMTAKEKECWKELNKKEGEVPIFSPHDLRHTFNTAGRNAKASDFNIQLLMNHTLSAKNMTDLYTSAQPEPLRQAQERIITYILNLIEPEKAGVVPIRRGRRKAR